MPLAFFPQRGLVELKNRQAAGIAALASPRGWKAAAETQADSAMSLVFILSGGTGRRAGFWGGEPSRDPPWDGDNDHDCPRAAG